MPPEDSEGVSELLEYIIIGESFKMGYRMG